MDWPRAFGRCTLWTCSLSFSFVSPLPSFLFERIFKRENLLQAFTFILWPVWDLLKNAGQRTVERESERGKNRQVEQSFPSSPVLFYVPSASQSPDFYYSFSFSGWTKCNRKLTDLLPSDVTARREEREKKKRKRAKRERFFVTHDLGLAMGTSGCWNWCFSSSSLLSSPLG